MCIRDSGYVNGSKLYLNKIGDTATAEVTYKTGKYDANGQPEGNVTSGKVTITAVELAYTTEYSFASVIPVNVSIT